MKKSRFYRFLRGTFLGLLCFCILMALLISIFLQSIKISPPEIKNKQALNWQREEKSKDFYTLRNSWLKKNPYGLWEMYVEGNGFERGVINGKLSKELVIKQEDYFVASIKEIVTSESYLRFLRYFIGFFDRKLPEYIPQEYQEEIYGVSQSASPDYGYIGTPYERLLNYHAAHDVGHALQGMNMVVGCTSFSAWGDHSADGSLIIGRNFDFYVGDDFAKNKIVEFIHPQKGHDFMMVTWGGMIGTVSGMNDQGLTLTINAAKSDYPTAAKTPIAIVTREILQYASDIAESYEIAKKRSTFVSETIMVGSVKDGKTALIEKSPSRIELVMPDKNYIICSNHYQGAEFSKDPENQENIKFSTSAYRYATVAKFLNETSKVGPVEAASILRCRKGKDGEELGMGNEKALNQLICHHSVIFCPAQGKAWISAGPYNLGTYVCYDLKKVFSQYKGLKEDINIFDSATSIQPDSFIYTRDYLNFEEFKATKHKLKHALLHDEKEIFDNPEKAAHFIALNPEYYDTYALLARYYAHFGDKEKAIEYYRKALSKNVASEAERLSFQKKIAELQKTKS